MSSDAENPNSLVLEPFDDDEWEFSTRTPNERASLQFTKFAGIDDGPSSRQRFRRVRSKSQPHIGIKRLDRFESKDSMHSECIQTRSSVVGDDAGETGDPKDRDSRCISDVSGPSVSHRSEQHTSESTQNDVGHSLGQIASPLSSVSGPDDVSSAAFTPQSQETPAPLAKCTKSHELPADTSSGRVAGASTVHGSGVCLETQDFPLPPKKASLLGSVKRSFMPGVPPKSACDSHAQSHAGEARDHVPTSPRSQRKGSLLGLLRHATHTGPAPLDPSDFTLQKPPSRKTSFLRFSAASRIASQNSAEKSSAGALGTATPATLPARKASAKRAILGPLGEESLHPPSSVLPSANLLSSTKKGRARINPESDVENHVGHGDSAGTPHGASASRPIARHDGECEASQTTNPDEKLVVDVTSVISSRGWEDSTLEDSGEGAFSDADMAKRALELQKCLDDLF